MRRALLTIVLAVLVIATPHADDALVGFYSAEGTNADGKPYSAAVQIVQTGQTYHVRWVTPEGEAIGVGLLEKNVLVVAFVAGQMIGIARYQVKKGTLTGTWSFVGYGGICAETLKKLEGKPATAPTAPPHPPTRQVPEVRERV